MSITKQQWLEMEKQACTCAMQFVQDAGYECCHPARGRHEYGALVYEYEFEVRRGPRPTRKTPVEHLFVRVRFTGPNHKTPRASFVTRPPEGTAC
jgi:hypothetical protein